MKKEISSVSVLVYYIPKKQTTLQTGASVKGLGACLLQQDRPVYFASDSLNQMRIATQEDDELALLKHTITHGWPSTIREVPRKIQPYWTFRRADSGRWYCLEGHLDSGTTQEMSSYITTYT